LPQRLSFHFPSVDEGYLRAGWAPGGLVAGVRKGEIVVHAGGQPVLIEPADWHEPAPGIHIATVEDNGRVAEFQHRLGLPAGRKTTICWLSICSSGAGLP